MLHIEIDFEECSISFEHNTKYSPLQMAAHIELCQLGGKYIRCYDVLIYDTKGHAYIAEEFIVRPKDVIKDLKIKHYEESNNCVINLPRGIFYNHNGRKFGIVRNVDGNSWIWSVRFIPNTSGRKLL